MKKVEQSELEQKILDQFLSGKNLFGEDGALAPLLKNVLDKALQAEMENHLNESERSSGNKRNGLKTKTVKSSLGNFELEVPQDRNSNFEPEIVKKRQTVLADQLADKIIGLYGLGMSYRDISSHIKEMYDTEVSHSVLSQITDRIIPEIKRWQNRPLESMYCIVWLDAMHYKVKVDGLIKSKALYNVLGVNKNGYKEVLGIYLSESEGANFWLSVLTDLNNRGLQDILIACTDNLKGFSEAILSVFPKTEIQKRVIHQIRNSLKYIASKDKKDFMKDLKEVYRADTKDLAEEALKALEEKWVQKYPLVIESWKNNWEELSTYFQYTKPIRKLIYTTNTVEGYHRQVRKVTKTKDAFPTDMALLKIVYLATMNIQKKWKAPLHNWSLTIQQLYIKFGNRIPLDLELR
ncbi:IS256 family transposase [Psychroflexus maritimus]|nr:IS256 family transposase [Psychroflexus maritimus]NGZ89400.1 IS256 family transposase [Psychroflexus maritimus]NGZ90081.1 IS256 family transposase [Psychroflexus maritimus]NGZ90400.1 IS256 family transposase [Psychroflexus maritimus]